MSTVVGLARCFGGVVRLISDLLSSILHYPQDIAPHMRVTLELGRDEGQRLQALVDQELRCAWEWIFCLMDSTESQLRFGATLSTSGALVAPPSASAADWSGGGPSSAVPPPSTGNAATGNTGGSGGSGGPPFSFSASQTTSSSSTGPTGTSSTSAARDNNNRDTSSSYSAMRQRQLA
ncbi:unnamed protein product [Cyprideis torosa]|uniref:Uncharacterized protein n=1 Tax=Cyprideis torosa TaxID=163714 RepID=A0A7R8ZS14_9CRUS|nr:unnamed protein product [Cyprideis torosa]CAG0905873.1 unnamed protein product [Cyprideis torosa]